MKKDHSMFSRRGFIKRGALFLPMIFVPQFGDKVYVELFNRRGSEVFWVHRDGGLQAASTIKQRTFSSVVDNRIRLTNSNFARLWSTDIGTSWSQIRVACRIGVEDTGANLTSTPRLAFGICSGTSAIFMDASTTHWMGAYTTLATWTRYAPAPSYNMSAAWNAAKRITTTTTTGTTFSGGSGYGLFDCTTAQRQVIAVDITKGSPNFTVNIFANNNYGSATDVTLATYLAQIPLATMVVSGHALHTAVTIAIDEATNGSFNAVNIAWDRTSPAIELSDIAVVKLA